MSTSPDATDAVIACPAEASEATLRLVFKSLPDDIREPHIRSILARSGDGRVYGLLAYRPNGETDAAIYVEPQAGRVASLWGPSVANDTRTDSESVIRALVNAGRRWAGKHQIELAQTLVSGDAAALAEIYAAAGFSIRTDLNYLVSEVHDVAPANGELQLHPYQKSDRDLLTTIIAQTYHETHDCPELNNLRDMNNVIDGYAEAGDSGDQHWFFVRRDEDNLGVLLLAEHIAQDQAELAYMGIVPRARGRGFGLQLTQLAQQKTNQLGRSRLILAVDARNQPAIDIYAQAGFSLWDRRTALLCPLHNR